MIINEKLRILPVGEVDERTLRVLSSRLKKLFSEIELLKPMPLIKSSYNPTRKQYLADDFLDKARSVPGDRILGVTDVDLYVPELNFVLGLAQLPGRAAIISLDRLHSRQQELFRSRMVKEAVHELGHTLGLRHCSDIYCVMHFSNSLMDTDVKGEIYCGICQELLYKI